MRFVERAVPSGLEGLVTRLWYLDAPRPRRFEKILPLPFAHLIVNLSEPYRVFDRSGTSFPIAGAFISGIRTDYLINELPQQVRHLGVEFTAVGLAALTGTTAVGRVVEAGEILAGIGGFTAALGSEPEPQRALDALSNTIATLPRSSPDAVVVAALGSLQADPEASIGELARRAGVSHRTLIVRFRAGTGLTPKAYAQLWRFHRLVTAAQSGRPTAWAELAAASGYYDQPHVIRDFRRFSGWTPTQYQRLLAEFGPAEANFVPLDQLPPDLTAQARS